MANGSRTAATAAGRIIPAIVAVTLLLAAALAGNAPAAGAAQGPRIVAKELVYDFGRVVQGTDATHIFEITNGGSEPLDIQRVQSS